MKLPKFRIKNNTNNWVYFTVFHNGMNTDNLIKETLGEFTGLLDRSGIEIYTGDIVSKWTRSGRNTKRLSKICFYKGSIVAFENKGYPSGKLWNLWSMCENFEVIGNIYENKDLLKT